MVLESHCAYIHVAPNQRSGHQTALLLRASAYSGGFESSTGKGMFNSSGNAPSGMPIDHSAELVVPVNPADVICQVHLEQLSYLAGLRIIAAGKNHEDIVWDKPLGTST